MAKLFGKNTLEARAKLIRTEDVQDKIELVKSWQKDYHSGSLLTDKETSREQQFNQDFFVKILEYREKPASPFSLEPKASTSGGQLPDAVLSYTDVRTGTQHVAAVVELKGAKIDLDRPQRREGNLSPVQQGFKYQRLYRECPFVIVSNFWEFRLYNDTILDFERWTLDDLVNPEGDFLKFKTWFLLLNRQNLTASDGISATFTLLSDIRRDQDQIGVKFYNDYRTARIELLRDLYRQNEAVRNDIDFGIEKAQKLVDRIVFCCFAEDRGLLPDDTIARVVQHADRGLGTLRNELENFFSAVNVGNQKLGIPTGYNGGLFRTDPELNALNISEDSLRRLTDLADYNFVEDLSVTILGHIFEESITDLEDIREKVARDKSIDFKALSRRKTDGIFYTPDHIVRYILDRTLGDYLQEIEISCRVAAGLKDTIQDSTYDRREKTAYRAYQTALQNLRIVDPACGSGAFLVHVFDFLMREHQRVGAVLGDLFSTEEYTRQILQGNIYGVDLNEESIEITKLSLWLKSATKNEKLTSLDGTIKCGNSVIEDSQVAGDKAFVWKSVFPEVFAEGGFDIVVGNPPYVNARTMRTEDRRYMTANYQGLKGAYDLYVVFLLLATRLLKESGRYGWIIPNKFLIADYALPAFNHLVDKSRVTIVDVSKLDVFAGVSVYPIILLGDLGPSGPPVRLRADSFDALQSGLMTEVVAVAPQAIANNDTLKTAGVMINAGTTGFEAQVVKGLLNEQRRGIPFAVSGSVDPYTLDTRRVPYMKTTYIHPHIEPDSTQVATSKYTFWKAKKIVIAGMTKRIEAVYVDTPLALGVGVYGIHGFAGYDPHALLGLLNSKFMSDHFREAFHDKHLSGGYLAVNKSNLEELPLVPVTELNESGVGDLAASIQNKTQDLMKLDHNLQTLVRSGSSLRVWPRKLAKWWSLSAEEILGALKKELTFGQRAQLLEVLDKYLTEARTLASEVAIEQTKLDDKVYALFGVGQAEIELIEARFDSL